MDLPDLDVDLSLSNAEAETESGQDPDGRRTSANRSGSPAATSKSHQNAYSTSFDMSRVRQMSYTGFSFALVVKL
jgi:hypothetical protein